MALYAQGYLGESQEHPRNIMGTARVAQGHHRSIMVASRGGTGAGEGACMVRGSMKGAGVP